MGISDSAVVNAHYFSCVGKLNSLVQINILWSVLMRESKRDGDVGISMTSWDCRCVGNKCSFRKMDYFTLLHLGFDDSQRYSASCGFTIETSLFWLSH